MFDIGGIELMVIAVVALLVIGPERLPEALRTLGLWFGRLRRTVTNLTSEIEKEIGMDDVRRQLHNEAVMEEMKRIEDEVKAANQSIMNSAPSNTDMVSEPTAARAPQLAEIQAEVEKTPGAALSDDAASAAEAANATLASSGDQHDTPNDAPNEPIVRPTTDAELEAANQKRQ